MTLEELRKVRALKLNAEIIVEELNALYFPYVSPNAPKSEGQNPNRGSDPTAQAYHKIQRKKQELERVRQEYTERVIEVEDWMRTIEDLEIVAIIRMHFLLGKTWRDTAKAVYGYAHRDTPRIRVERFMKGESVRIVTVDP